MSRIIPMFAKTQNTYTLQACYDLMAKYFEKGGECITLEEGCLGLGLVVCYGDGLKTAIIKEIYLNEWSSAHTIRMYKKMPKKYEKLLEEKLENWESKG